MGSVSACVEANGIEDDNLLPPSPSLPAYFSCYSPPVLVHAWDVFFSEFNFPALALLARVLSRLLRGA